MGRWLILLVLVCGTSAHAMWPPAESVPVERLLQNIQAEVKEYPQEAYLHYLHARVRSLAFSNSKQEVRVLMRKPGTRDEPFHFPGYETLQVSKAGKDKLTEKDLEHLRTSLTEYKLAIDLDATNELAKLGFAWMHEEAAPHAAQLKTLPWIAKDPLTPAVLRQESLKLYRELYKEAKPKDLANSFAMGLPEEFLSQEAGEAIIRLGKAGATPAPTKAELADIQNTSKKIAAKGRMVTPIIFSIARKPGLSHLVNRSARVNFDLAGDGRKRSWPWVTEGAAFLAWDPKGTGKIASGRQLFGSATFWMFFKDGYRALSALDDNRDGRLRDKELLGIVVWHDKNGNAISDKGEVRSLKSWGIVELGARADSTVEGTVTCKTGIVWRDGGASASIDWTPRSHAQATARRRHGPVQLGQHVQIRPTR